jgi:serine/threonine protein kinase
MIGLPTQQLGNYRLIRLIGEGGFAEVYLGEHVYLKTYAAIKVLQTRLANEKQEDFLAEARSIAHLKHINIVRVLEFGVEGTIPFLVMDYASDGTLRQQHPSGTRVPPAHVAAYVKQIADALQYAHNRHIVHRDIKPENILQGARNKLLLSDFGIARVVESAFEQNSQEIIGTITYMAPEQLQNRPCPASDQYSLGAVIYEWLSGDYLFHGSFTEIASQHLLAPPPSFREKGIDIAPEIEQAVMKALAKDPQQRFATVHEFATALEQSSQLTPPVQVRVAPSSNSTIQESYSDSLLGHTTQPAPIHQPVSNDISRSTRAELSSRPRSSFGKILLFTGIVILAILSSSGLTYYFTVLRPASQQNTAQFQQITATAQANENSTTALQALYTKTVGGKPLLNSPLNANDRNDWLEYDSKTFGSCTFKKGAYYASMALGSYYYLCGPLNANIPSNNFLFQAELTITRGDMGGIIFNSSYGFNIEKDGSYNFSTHDNTSNIPNTILNGFSPFIKTGLNQTNTVAVIARGSHFYFYINKHYVAQAGNTSSSVGSIGVAAQNITHATEVAFRNAQVWKL